MFTQIVWVDCGGVSLRFPSRCADFQDNQARKIVLYPGIVVYTHGHCMLAGVGVRGRTETYRVQGLP